jgi:predicted membrane protein DUF2306
MTSGRTIRWLIFMLSLSISLLAARFFVLPLAKAASGPLGRHLADHGWLLYAHAGGGAIALLSGAVQWLRVPRIRRSRWHRLVGRTYVAAIGVAGAAGLVMAFNAAGGLVARGGFAGLAAGWLVTTAIAFTRARAGAWAAHRNWMLRSFSLTFAAVTLRLWLPALAMAGVSFAVAYPLTAWLCWVPNLMTAEFLIRRTPLDVPAHVSTRAVRVDHLEAEAARRLSLRSGARP